MSAPSLQPKGLGRTRSGWRSLSFLCLIQGGTVGTSLTIALIFSIALSVSSLKSLSCHPTLDCYRKGDVDSSQSWAAKTRYVGPEVREEAGGHVAWWD